MHDPEGNDEDFLEPVINIWDTQYAPRGKAFSILREVSKLYMPWSHELSRDVDFQGRAEMLSKGRKSVGKFQQSPMVASRSVQDIANSQFECYYANYILYGDLKVEQGGTERHLRAGDISLSDGSRPVKLTTKDGQRFDSLVFLIPKESIAHSGQLADYFNNGAIQRESLLFPLASSLQFLSENMLTAAPEELSCVLDACISLMPLAVGAYEVSRDKRASKQPNLILRDILDRIHRNIADAGLSPQKAAEEAGVSLRYVHKLFASHGTTFNTYITAKRLEQVCRDLQSTEFRRQSISAIAYRWGFNDFSTFYRAFKKRYGCSPSKFR